MPDRDPAEMLVRERIAELAGNRVLNADEEVALRVAADELYLALVLHNRDQFTDAIIQLVEAWPRNVARPDTL